MDNNQEGVKTKGTNLLSKCSDSGTEVSGLNMSKNLLNNTLKEETRNPGMKIQSSQEPSNDSAFGVLKAKHLGSRAGSVKNSRRYNRKNTSGSLKSKNNVFSSYLPLQNYMVSRASRIKPVRQMQREKRSFKSAISDRKGNRTVKNAQALDSKETFEDFVEKMQREIKPIEAKPKQRPYTSNGQNQFRIKNQRRTLAKSRAATKKYEALKKAPYFNNRVYIPSKMKKKPQTRLIGYRPNCLNSSESEGVKYPQAFYPTSSGTFASKTTLSNDTFVKNCNKHFQNSYGNRIGSQDKCRVKKIYLQKGKESTSTKNTSCNHTTTEVSMDVKPLSQRKSCIKEKEKNKALDMINREFNSSSNGRCLSDLGDAGKKVIRHKPKISDLYNYKEGDPLDTTLTKLAGQNFTNHKEPQLIAPISVSNNMKKIPAMMQDLVLKEKILRRVSLKEVRGHSESNARIGAMSNCANKKRGSSYERDRSIKDYKMGRQIGKGAYAVVRMVIDKTTKQQQAMKIYEKYKLTDAARRKSVSREIAIMKKISHPNIVKMITSFDNPHSIYIIMEHVKGRSLYRYLKERPGKRLPEEEAKIIIRQIAEAIDYVHGQNVAHRDMKLENLIINSATKKITLIDFGFSITSGHEKKLKIFCGTPSYMSPEIIAKRDYLGPPVDIWAFGILCYVMLCGKFPFRGYNERDLYKKISYGRYYWPSDTQISTEAQALVKACLCVNTKRRANIKQVLESKWLAETHEE
ncbi:unnamed protein product [Moneuplotes crassus]|uniref:Protein kinase domain-containing protein n=1 Tax=Euplotes crassus TaxID=5936 RepID=A0AAD1YB47_EUPCR|nr:unnamed protein product [Moneuplotes crassus]